MPAPRLTRALSLVAILSVAGPFVAGLAAAGGMKITPGEWEFQTVMKPAMGAPSKPEKRCIAQDEISPAELTKEMKNCQVSDMKSDSKSMSWNLTCANPHGEMKGTAHFKSNGDAIEGEIRMSMAMGAHAMKVSVDSKGKRLGDCS